MSVYIEQSATDSAMYEVYSQQGDKRILWAVVHEDMLGYLEGESIEHTGTLQLSGVAV